MGNDDYRANINISRVTFLVSKYRKELMGVSALFIYYFHNHACFLMGMGFLGVWEEYLKRILFFGVDMFLVLSGIGVAYSLNKNKTSVFYLNRFKRIYPPVLIGAFIMMKVDHWPFILYIKKVTGYAFLFEWFHSFLWFFPSIVIFYIVSPFANRILKKSKNKLMVVLLFSVYYIILVNFIDRKTTLSIWDYYCFLNRAPIFLFGMYLGNMNIDNEKCSEGGLANTKVNIQDIILYIGMVIVGGFLAYVTCYEDQWVLVPSSNVFLPNILLSVPILFMLALLFEKLDNTKNVSKKIVNIVFSILGFYGMISFEFYIVQEWLRGKVLNIISIEGRINSIKYNIICFLVSTAAATCLYYVAKYIVKGVSCVCSKIKGRH